MTIALDTLQQRVIGVLIEKEMTVPDSYPLTLGALLAGCNQKNNRDPQMQVEDFDVEGAVRALMDQSWVARRETGGRVHRFAHGARDQLGVDAADLALLSELLCRGPQASGALKTRATRMHRFANPAEVEARLEALAQRPVPYVCRLPKRPREQQPRWTHLLDGRTPEQAIAAAPADADHAAAPAAPFAAPPGGLAARVVELETRLEALAERVAQLEDRWE